MPEKVLKDRVAKTERVLDARPDRVDYRDLRYRARLVSLPPAYPDAVFIKQHLQSYARTFVLDQGSEGACTGFGLAAMVNYLLWVQPLRVAPNGPSAASAKRRAPARGARRPPPVRVSAAMLYHLARVYDEWAGDDYEGSSCRGAMKGWHRHGVCTERHWPYTIKNGSLVVEPKQGWQIDAALRPLGAYYRIDKTSIVDMQSAICEVGAIYASGDVSESWNIKRKDTLQLIPPPRGEVGGHAFAIVGYTRDGFIVQNSWGPTWGYYGFAVMAYEDWVRSGADAWVATLGAPIAIDPRSAAATDRSRRELGARDTADGKASWFWSPRSTHKPQVYKNPRVEPWEPSVAYEHSIVLGNDGEALHRLVDHASGASAVEECALVLPRKWLKSKGSKKLAIYAHGGLNSEEDSVRRIRVLAPYFAENGIYPLFLTWRTGVWESITGMLADAAKRLWPFGDMARGLGEDIANRLADARDRTIELASRSLGVKAIWSEMKENAAGSVVGGGGVELLAGHLKRLAGDVPGLEVHLVGHSAGAILLGHLLDELADVGGKASTCTLYAPACTVAFANERYGGASKKGVLSIDRLEVHLLSDECERADSVGPYGKSLLYLVSRALETLHKTPLLGLANAWDKTKNGKDLWDEDTLNHVKRWQSLVAGEVEPVLYDRAHVVHDGVGPVSLAHGSFDNDVAVISRTLERIAGTMELPTPVDVLRGF